MASTTRGPRPTWSSMISEKMDKQWAPYLSGLLIAMVADINTPLSWTARIADEGDRVIMKGPYVDEAIVCDAHLAGRPEDELVCRECMISCASFFAAVVKHPLYADYWTTVLNIESGTVNEQFSFVSYKIPEPFIEACKGIIDAINSLADINVKTDAFKEIASTGSSVVTVAGKYEVMPLVFEWIPKPMFVEFDVVTPRPVKPSRHFHPQPDDNAVLAAIVKFSDLLEAHMIANDMPSDILNTVDFFLLPYSIPDYAKFLGKKLIWNVMFAAIEDCPSLPQLYRGGTEDSVLALVWTNEVSERQTRVVMSDTYINFFYGKRAAFEGEPLSYPQPTKTFLRRQFGPVQMWQGVVGIIDYLSAQDELVVQVGK